jgi:hypothetical protein
MVDAPEMQLTFNKALDAAATVSIVGSMIGWLPYIASVLSIIWFLIQISESHTVVAWRDARKTRRRAKKIARLRAQEKILSAEIIAMETVRSAKADARELVATAKVEAIMGIVHDDANAAAERLAALSPIGLLTPQ